MAVKFGNLNVKKLKTRALYFEQAEFYKHLHGRSVIKANNDDKFFKIVNFEEIAFSFQFYLFDL